MSKSRGNVINPDDVIKEYGADSLRLYEMFLGPLEVSKPWISSGIIGVSRFLERLWAISEKLVCAPENSTRTGERIVEQMQHGVGQVKATTTTKFEGPHVSNYPDMEQLTKLLHRTIKKVTDDTSIINFNTAISAMMIYSSELAKLAEIPRALWEPLVIMAGAYAPHLGEELWEKLGHKGSVSACRWPVYDKQLTVFDEVTVVIQVNGKIRDKFIATAGTAKDELEKTALALPGVKKWLEGQTVVKIIVIPDKLVNIVVK